MCTRPKKCDNNQCGGFIYPVNSPCETCCCCWTCNITLILMFVFFYSFSSSSDTFTRSKLRILKPKKNFEEEETKRTQSLFVEHILFAINVIGNFFLSLHGRPNIENIIYASSHHSFDETKQNNMTIISCCDHIPCAAISFICFFTYSTKANTTLLSIEQNGMDTHGLKPMKLIKAKSGRKCCRISSRISGVSVPPRSRSIVI